MRIPTSPRSLLGYIEHFRNHRELPRALSRFIITTATQRQLQLLSHKPFLLFLLSEMKIFPRGPLPPAHFTLNLPLHVR